MKWTVLVIPFATAGAMAVQLAEIPVPDLGNATATAILGWYAWHTASRTIPGLVKDFRDEMAAGRAENRADRDVFRGELAEERHCRHADNLAVLAALREMTAVNPAANLANSPEGQVKSIDKS